MIHAIPSKHLSVRIHDFPDAVCGENENLPRTYVSSGYFVFGLSKKAQREPFLSSQFLKCVGYRIIDDSRFMACI